MLDVTPAERRDIPAIVDLIEEMDRFYGGTTDEPLSQRLKQTEDMLFGDVPAAHVLLARTDGQVVGFAAYSFLWPAAGLTHSLYLKELYVGQAWRGRGVGTALMRRIREVAATAGCSRVEWTTDDDNSAAKRFYEALGAPVHPAKIFYRLEGGADSGSRPVDDVG